MTRLLNDETILERQLTQLVKFGISDVVITTGYLENQIVEHCKNLNLPINIRFVKNERFSETNYIYSIYCAKEYLKDDIVFMHGDLVFEDSVLEEILNSPHSCMAVSSTSPLPEKDFKAQLYSGKISKIGINYFDNAVAAQPLYKITKRDWKIWLNKICEFIKEGNNKVYAENAFNEVSDECIILPLDVKQRLCEEIDNVNDLERVRGKLQNLQNETNAGL